MLSSDRAGGFIQFRIRVDEDLEPGATGSLYRWLVADSDLEESVEVRLDTTVQPVGSMGVLEVIDVVLSGATGVSSLIVSILTWRANRGGHVPVSLETDTRSIPVEGGTDPASVDRTVTELESAAEDTEDGSA